jgi:hypothetical protein
MPKRLPKPIVQPKVLEEPDTKIHNWLDINNPWLYTSSPTQIDLEWWNAHYEPLEDTVDE